VLMFFSMPVLIPLLQNLFNTGFSFMRLLVNG